LRRERESGIPEEISEEAKMSVKLINTNFMNSNKINQYVK
jgi:hypothetical protein